MLSVLKGRNVVIQTHNFPDPDAIGTAFGLQNLLKNFGINAVCVYCGKVDKLSTKLMIDVTPRSEHTVATKTITETVVTLVWIFLVIVWLIDILESS